MEELSKEDLIQLLKELQHKVKVLEKQIQMIKEFYEE